MEAVSISLTLEIGQCLTGKIYSLQYVHSAISLSDKSRSGCMSIGLAK